LDTSQQLIQKISLLRPTGESEWMRLGEIIISFFVIFLEKAFKYPCRLGQRKRSFSVGKTPISENVRGVWDMQ